MPDPRVTKLAKVMVHYSLQLKPGQQVLLQTTPLADELSLAFIEEAVKAGAQVFKLNAIPGASEISLKHSSDEQLDFVSPVRKLIYETFEARMVIEADSNTSEMAGRDPKRIARFRKANAGLFKIFMDRIAKGDMHWCLTVYPTEAMAQEANMSLSDYREFVFGAGMLNEDDPVAFWKNEAEKQKKLADWLKAAKRPSSKAPTLTCLSPSKAGPSSLARATRTSRMEKSSPARWKIRSTAGCVSSIPPSSTDRRSRTSSCGSRTAGSSRRKPAKIRNC